MGRSRIKPGYHMRLSPRSVPPLSLHFPASLQQIAEKLVLRNYCIVSSKSRVKPVGADSEPMKKVGQSVLDESVAAPEEGGETPLG